MGQPAARVGDLHVCPMVTPGLPPVPHVGGPILPPGMPTVFIGGMPAATVGSMCVCVGPPDVILRGSFTVLIGSRPAARMGDSTAHGGTITIGFPTVLIGDAGGGGGAGAGGFPVTIEDQSWWHITDWPDLLTSTPPDIYYGTIVIAPSPTNPDFQAQALADLMAIDQTPSGHRLLQSLNDSGRTVTVKDNIDPQELNAHARPNDSANAQRKSDGTPGTGSDATVNYNPNISTLNNDPWMTAPSAVWLSHELVHADHYTHGTRSTGTAQNDGQYEPDGTPSQMRVEELNTAGIPPHAGSGKVNNEDSGVTENDIRQEWPDPLIQRPYY